MMARYTEIQWALFGQSVLELPMSLRVARSAQPQPAGGEGERFVANIEVGRAIVLAEVRIRGMASAEALTLGQADRLTVKVGPAASGMPPRMLCLPRAVLVAVELDYQQAIAATALLRFAAEADENDGNPFTAEDVK